MSAPAELSASAEDSPPVVAILAGGLATRLYPRTESLPKSMLPIAGKPFIAHQLRLLATQGFEEVVICAGHLAGQIQDFVGEGAVFGCRVRYSFDGEQMLGTGGALRRALPMLGQSFLVLYGDSYLTAPFRPVWDAFRKSGKAALMTVFRNDHRWDKSNVELQDGRIVRYDKTAPAAAMRYIDYGLGCIRSEALLAWPPGARFDLALFYQAMLGDDHLAGVEVRERFYEIGSPQGLAETDALLAKICAADVIREKP